MTTKIPLPSQLSQPKSPPIIQATYSVHTEIQKVAAHYPVNFRHTLGMRLAQSACEFFTEILKTNASKDYQKRHEALLDLRTKLYILGMEIRLGRDLKLISQSQHGQIHERLIDIRKQLCGWQRWTKEQT